MLAAAIYTSTKKGNSQTKQHTGNPIRVPFHTQCVCSTWQGFSKHAQRVRVVDTRRRTVCSDRKLRHARQTLQGVLASLIKRCPCQPNQKGVLASLIKRCPCQPNQKGVLASLIKRCPCQPNQMVSLPA